MSDAKGPRWIGWTVTYVVLLVISGGLLVAAFYAPKESFWAHMLNELGIAGIVAFVLALTIERLSTEEFRSRAEAELAAQQQEFRSRAEAERAALKEEFRKLAEEERAAIKKDVFYQAYGRMIPQDIRDELDRHVLQSDFIRSGLYLHFDLTVEKDPKTAKEYVKSKISMRSQIKNLSGQPRQFPIEHAIDRSPSDALQSEVKYLDFQAAGCEAPFSLNESDLKAITGSDAGQVALDFSKANGKYKVVVLPEQLTTLKVHYQGIRILEGGGIYFFFTTHTSDLELTVHVKNRDLNVSSVAYSPHRLLETERHDPENGYYNWSLNKPLLCYQAVRITWELPRVQPPPVSQTVVTPPAAVPPDLPREGPS
jgi:hypothetical protein